MPVPTVVTTAEVPPWITDVGVLLATVHGLIRPAEKGSFIQTEKGSALQTLLDATPSHDREGVVMGFLGLDTW